MIQDTMFQQIKIRHMSKHGLEDPPEQESDILEAKTSANDKWAQCTAQQKKTKVGWPYWVADRLGWSADGPVGPTASGLPCGTLSLDV